MAEEEKIPILHNDLKEKKQIKLILCGDYGSGKTSLLERHVSNSFQEGRQSSKNMSKVKLNIKIKQKIESLLIWDTNGEEKYQSLQMNHFRNADCAIIVFDVSKESSFESLEYWYKMVRLYAPTIPILVAGNKYDKRVMISFDEASYFCEKNDCDLIYCSAKTGLNVNKAFRQIVQSHFNIKNDGEIDENEDESLVMKNNRCRCCNLL